MTQQNVVVSDPKSGINLTIPMKVPVSKPPPGPGSCITISRKTLLEINGNNSARINSWVESMRASSPTHHKSTPAISDDLNSWMVSLKKKNKQLSCNYIYNSSIIITQRIMTPYICMYQ